MPWVTVAHGAGVRRVWSGPPTPVLTAEQQGLLDAGYDLLDILNGVIPPLPPL